MTSPPLPPPSSLDNNLLQPAHPPTATITSQRPKAVSPNVRMIDIARESGLGWYARQQLRSSGTGTVVPTLVPSIVPTAPISLFVPAPAPAPAFTSIPASPAPTPTTGPQSSPPPSLAKVLTLQSPTAYECSVSSAATPAPAIIVTAAPTATAITTTTVAPILALSPASTTFVPSKNRGPGLGLRPQDANLTGDPCSIGVIPDNSGEIAYGMYGVTGTSLFAPGPYQFDLYLGHSPDKGPMIDRTPPYKQTTDPAPTLTSATTTPTVPNSFSALGKKKAKTPFVPSAPVPPRRSTQRIKHAAVPVTAGPSKLLPNAASMPAPSLSPFGQNKAEDAAALAAIEPADRKNLVSSLLSRWCEQYSHYEINPPSEQSVMGNARSVASQEALEQDRDPSLPEPQYGQFPMRNMLNALAVEAPNFDWSNAKNLASRLEEQLPTFWHQFNALLAHSDPSSRPPTTYTLPEDKSGQRPALHQPISRAIIASVVLSDPPTLDSNANEKIPGAVSDLDLGITNRPIRRGALTPMLELNLEANHTLRLYQNDHKKGEWLSDSLDDVLFRCRLLHQDLAREIRYARIKRNSAPTDDDDDDE